MLPFLRLSPAISPEKVRTSLWISCEIFQVDRALYRNPGNSSPWRGSNAVMEWNPTDSTLILFIWLVFALETLKNALEELWLMIFVLKTYCPGFLIKYSYEEFNVFKKVFF